MFDLIVIGSGWAGFNAGLRASLLGKKVAIVDQAEIGGVCLNRGCIPTKALVHSSRLFKEAKGYKDLGIELSGIIWNFSQVQAYKNQVVSDLRQGLLFQLNRQKIEFLKGQAKIIGKHEVEINGKSMEAEYLIIASGSVPVELSSLKFDGNKVISSDQILELSMVPENLLVVGGGAIGCEFVSIFSALGSRVTIVEALERLLPQEDPEVSKKITMVFKKNGIEVLTGSRMEDVDISGFDKILVCIGRRPHTAGLWSEELPIKTEKNKIVVNQFLQTSVENIYAAGDCIGGKMLAHVAEYEGVLAAENIFTNPRPADYSAVPNCIFTHPEIASVGLSADEAKSAGREIKTSRFDFLANGMAHILNETDGFIKLVADKNSDELLGGAIVGPKAAELIGILTVSIRNKLKSKDVHETIFAHPSLCEGISQAARNLSQI